MITGAPYLINSVYFLLNIHKHPSLHKYNFNGKILIIYQLSQRLVNLSEGIPFKKLDD